MIVTSNAADRIDSAFQRRFDLVVDFRQPDVEERWAIWQLHLPPGHTVDHTMLGNIVGYCVLSGGQIRNAVQHASLVALHDGGVITSEHLKSSILREYRKMGALCPLYQSSVSG
jgi:SpoVK/Ycf46/Vps4 family AAA+-type ATPase